MRDVSEKSKTASNRGTGKRIRLLMFAMLGFMTWACFMFWNQQGQLNAKAAQLAQLENVRQETADLNESYKKEIQRLNDSEYILQKNSQRISLFATGGNALSYPQNRALKRSIDLPSHHLV